MNERPLADHADPSDHADPIADGDPADQERSEQWRRILTGEDRGMLTIRRAMRLIPSSPRCKLCATPFGGPGQIVTRVLNHGRSNANPLMCSACFSSLGKHVGGAEVEISVLFADVRGSTGLAEQTSAAQFRRLIQEFYGAATEAIEGSGGVVDKFLGDGVMALFIPVFTGEDHRARAIGAGVAILRSAQRPVFTEAGVHVGVGVHGGPAFVGTIGSGDRIDFTALGDTVNVAARLGSMAGPGELLVGASTWDAASPSIAGAERRSIPIRSRTADLEVVVVREGASEGATRLGDSVPVRPARPRRGRFRAQGPTSPPWKRAHDGHPGTDQQLERRLRDERPVAHRHPHVPEGDQAAPPRLAAALECRGGG